MNSEGTINFIISYRNREAKSAYAISEAKGRGFIVDCDSGDHSTNLTTILREILRVSKIDPEKHDRSEAIQLKIGDIWLPPIIMNNNNDPMEDIPSSINRFYDEKNDNFSFPVRYLEIGQFHGNIRELEHPSLRGSNPRVSYNHVFLDCSGHLLVSGTLEKSLQKIKEKHLFWRNVLYYVMRTRDIVSQRYYNERSSEERRQILLYCIQEELHEKLHISSGESSHMAQFVDGIVLIFNLFKESEGVMDRIFGEVLEKDLYYISSTANLLRARIPRPSVIYIIKTCNKLLEDSKKPHERIYDYLTASVDELPDKCMKRIG